MSGKGAEAAFAQEAGGHRWQHVPATERHGRVQSSSVTVAVLPEPTATEVVLRDSDLDWSSCRAGGKGGQSVNTTNSAVRLVHKPTGLSIRVETERSQKQNREVALSLLRARLHQAGTSEAARGRADDRKRQLGCGSRGDKVVTVRVQDGVVIDHRTGAKVRLKDYREGIFNFSLDAARGSK